jgi:hypothetical protein
VYKISPSDWSVGFAAQSGTIPTDMAGSKLEFLPIYLGSNRFSLVLIDSNNLVLQWDSETNDVISN